MLLALLIFSVNRDLQDLDASVHWFCDRKDGPSQQRRSSAPDDPGPSALELSVRARHALVLDCLHIFAYDSPDIEPQKTFLALTIDRHLGNCDVCIIEYYKVKHKLMDKLRECVIITYRFCTSDECSANIWPQ